MRGSYLALHRVWCFPVPLPNQRLSSTPIASDCLQAWLTTAIPLSSRRILVRALSTSLEYNEPVCLSTVAMVKLWHVIKGLYMCVCPTTPWLHTTQRAGHH